MAFNEDKTLKINWNKKEGWMIYYPTRATGSVTSDFIGGGIDFPKFIEELKDRGFDTTSLTLTVHKREFKCTKSYFKDGRELFKEGDIYYLHYIDNDTKKIYIMNGEGYSFPFTKFNSDGDKIDLFFTEIIKNRRSRH